MTSRYIFSFQVLRARYEIASWRPNVGLSGGGAQRSRPLETPVGRSAGNREVPQWNSNSTVSLVKPHLFPLQHSLRLPRVHSEPKSLVKAR